jgi:Tol biopolymer transport system component
MKSFMNRNPAYIIILIISVLIINAEAQVKPKKLFGSPDKDYMAPCWSPDGSEIAFTSAGYKGIWIINLSNNDVKHITDEIASGFGYKWADNSQTILTRVAKYEGIRRYNAVKTFDVLTGGTKLLTDYRTMMPGLPSFFPGDEKVFMYGRNRLEVFNSQIEPKLNKTGSNSSKIIHLRDDKIVVEDLTTNQIKMYEPVKNRRVLNLQVSPDGSKMVFEIYGGDMYVIKNDGSDLTNLGKGYRPKWSPDNQHIVYMITEDDGVQILSSDIYTIKIDGTEKTNLTGTDEIIEMNPDWSPNGKKIAFDIPSEGAIFIMNAP